MAVGKMRRKFGEIRVSSSTDMLVDRQTNTHTDRDRQTDRHVHHNTAHAWNNRELKLPSLEVQPTAL